MNVLSGLSGSIEILQKICVFVGWERSSEIHNCSFHHLVEYKFMVYASSAPGRIFWGCFFHLIKETFLRQCVSSIHHFVSVSNKSYRWKNVYLGIIRNINQTRPHKIIHTIKYHIRLSMTIQYHSRLYNTLKAPKGQNNYIPYETIQDQTKPNHMWSWS